MKQARSGHWRPGILRGDCGGTNKPILGAKPSIFPYIYTRMPPQDLQVPVSNPGLFHTLDIHTLPFRNIQILYFPFCSITQIPHDRTIGNQRKTSQHTKKIERNWRISDLYVFPDFSDFSICCLFEQKRNSHHQNNKSCNIFTNNLFGSLPGLQALPNGL